MKFCHQCGKQEPDNAIFCGYCGSKFEQVSQPNIPITQQITSSIPSPEKSPSVSPPQIPRKQIPQPPVKPPSIQRTQNVKNEYQGTFAQEHDFVSGINDNLKEVIKNLWNKFSVLENKTKIAIVLSTLILLCICMISPILGSLNRNVKVSITPTSKPAPSAISMDIVNTANASQLFSGLTKTTEYQLSSIPSKTVEPPVIAPTETISPVPLLGVGDTLTLSANDTQIALESETLRNSDNTPTEIIGNTDVQPTQIAQQESQCPKGCISPPAGCTIKGNISTNGEKIYHTPDGKSYSRTKIDPSAGERWFCTSAEAIANGWRDPNN